MNEIVTLITVLLPEIILRYQNEILVYIIDQFFWNLNVTKHFWWSTRGKIHKNENKFHIVFTCIPFTNSIRSTFDGQVTS